MYTMKLSVSIYHKFTSPSLFQFFQCFDRYNSHSQGLDVEQKVYILFQKLPSNGLSILQLSNMLMHEFSYDNLKPKYELKIKFS